MKKNKMINYIKDNKLFCGVMFISFILLLIQMSQVVMYADDYALKVISNQGWNAIFLNQYNHYFNWGGGFTPILVTSFLRGSFWLWKIFISINLLLIVGLAVKFLNLNSDKEKAFIATLILDCYFFVSISVTRQTMYWLDGSMAYVFTTLQVFLYIYYFVSRLFNNVHKKYDIFLFPIIAFFAGWSSAQSGAIAFIIPTLIMVYAYFLKKIKPKLYFHIINLLGIIGFGIFYFAPGNSVRMSVMTDFVNLSFFSKITYRINNIFSLMFDFKSLDYTAMTFFILLFFGLLICYGVNYIKHSTRKNILLKISTAYLAIFLIIDFCIGLNIPGFDSISKITMNFSNIYASGITLGALFQYGYNMVAILCSIVSSYYISKNEKNDMLIILPIILYCSQFVMIMAPYSEYRTELIGLVFLWINISYLFLILYKKKISVLQFILIPYLMFNFYIIIFFIKNLFVNEENKNRLFISEYSLILIVFSLIAFANYFDTFYKYKENKKVYNQNLEIINDSKEKDVIYLHDYPNILYGFGGIVGIDYVEESLKKTFNLKKGVIFKSIESEENKNE